MENPSSTFFGTPARTRRIRVRGGPLGVGLVGAALIGLLTVFATGGFAATDFRDPSIFEIDRDAVTNLGQGGDDWDAIAAGTSSALASTGLIVDSDAPIDVTNYTEGSKDVLDVDAWTYTDSKGGIPDKNEILDAYAAAYAEDGHLLVYYGLDRYANDGSAELGFWFFQDDVSLAPPDSQGKGDFIGKHQVGDVLILADFTDGGQAEEVLAYKWVGGKDPLELIASGSDCIGGDPADDICATVNQADALAPWPFTPKFGSPGTFPPLTFFEGGIDLTNIFGSNTGCFSSFLASTRASFSTTAALHDFALGSFDVCDVDIAISPQEDANQVGDEHEFTVTVTKKDHSTGFDFGPAEGAEVTATIDSGPGSFVGQNICTTGSAGTCTVTISSAGTGLTTVSASAIVPVNGETRTVSTTAVSGDSSPADKRWVDARLSLTPPKDANQVGDTHTFTAHLEFDYGDDEGFVDAPADETIDLGVVDGPGSLSADDCTTDTDGTCTVDLDSDSTGLSIVQAAWGGIVATAEGNAAATAGPDTAVKRWVDVRLNLTPPEAVNHIGDTPTFTAHLEFDTGDGFAAAAGETIGFSITGGPGTLSDDSCVTGGDGTCTVDLDSDSVGQTDVQGSWSGDVATAEGTVSTAASDDALKHWIDLGAFITIDPPEAANQVGDPHTFTVTVYEKDTSTNFEFAPAPGVDVTAEITDGPGSFVDDVNTCTTEADGTCDVVIVSSQTGLTTVSASATVLADDLEVPVTTDGTSGSSDPAVKRWVDARLSLTPSEDANQVGDTHTFTAHLEFDTGSGFANAPAGETISFSKLSGVGALAGDSCITVGDGTCTVDLSSGTTGLTTVEASWSGGVATAQGTASASADPDTAVKRWVDVRLSLTPPEAVNQIGDTHTFTASLEFDTGSGFAAAAGETIGFSITEGPGTLSGESCTTGDDGSCTVDLDSGSVGLTRVQASWSGNVVTDEGTVDTGTSDDAVKHWIDLGAFIRIDPPEDANQVGDPHTFTVTVFEKDTSTNFEFAPATGVAVTTAITSGPGAFVNDVNTCTTGAAGTCDVVIVSSQTGLTTVSASATVLADDLEIGVATDGTSANSGPATKRWVDARLSLTPPEDTNQVGDTHSFTAHLEFDTGSGFVDAPAGKTIAFTTVSGPGGLTSSSCATDTDGTCSVDLESAETGLTTVQASWSGEIATAQGDANASAQPVHAVKRWVDVRLSLTPPEDANQVGDTHTLTALLEFDTGGGFAAAVGKSVGLAITDGPGSLSADACTTGDDGTCTVDLDSEQTGLTTVQASWNGEISTAEGSATASVDPADAVKRWVDARIAVTPPTATNVVGDTHTFVADLEFDHGDGNSWVDAPAGETIGFTKTTGPGDFVDGVNTCITGDAGTCSVELDSAEVGVTTVAAAWTGEIATAEGDATASAGSDDASKLWVNPSITIVKEADPAIGPPRDVTYTYLVTNTGDVTLAPVRVTDDVLGDIGEIDELAPGESALLSSTVAVDATTPVVNVGTACGDPSVDGQIVGGEVCAEDDATISVVLGIEIERLPRTGASLHLQLFAAGLLLWLGAACLALQGRLRRWPHRA